MRKSTSAALLAITATAAITPLAAIASAAPAASTARAAVQAGGSFFTSENNTGNLVTVSLDSNGHASDQKLVKAAKSGDRLAARNALGKYVAGEQLTTDASTVKTEVFTIKRSGASIHMFGAKTSSPWLYAKGKKVAFVKQTGTKSAVRESASKGGKAKTVFTAKAKQLIGGLATSADGKTLFVAENLANGSARIMKVTKGKAHAFGPSYKTTTIHSLAISRNGKTLAYGLSFTGIAAKKSVVLAKVAKGGISKHIAYQGFPQNLTWTADGRGLTIDDTTSSGWTFINVATGAVTADSFISTLPYSHPSYF